jgi:alpha-1,3-rhamnosyl/mannosyltransferase
VVVVGGGTDALDVRGVIGLGHIDDSAWASVLRGAEALVYTSAYEGQGLPPLEAIACGTPVIGMSNTAIPEVVGDAGFLLEEHHDDDDATLLAAETLRIVEDRELRAELARACAGQSAQFPADRFAQQIGNAYSVAVARRS